MLTHAVTLTLKKMEVKFNLIYTHNPKPSINANAQPIKHKEMTKLESRPSWRNSKIRWDGEWFIGQEGKNKLQSGYKQHTRFGCEGVLIEAELLLPHICVGLHFAYTASTAAGVQGGVRNCYRGYTSRNNPCVGSLSHMVWSKAFVATCNHFYMSKTVKNMHRGYVLQSKRQQPGACTDLSS